MNVHKIIFFASTFHYDVIFIALLAFLSNKFTLRGKVAFNHSYYLQNFPEAKPNQCAFRNRRFHNNASFMRIYLLWNVNILDYFESESFFFAYGPYSYDIS